MRKPLAWSPCVSLILALLMHLPAQANDALKFRVTTLQARAYSYWRFSSAARAIQTGDCLEYDVYLNSNVPGLGGIDIRNTDLTYWRDSAGWADQNGIGGHPGQDLTSRAYRKWYHRTLPVPAAMVGKTTQRWDVVLDGYNYGAYECYSAVYDNVRITNGGSTVLNVYTDGGVSVNAQDFALSGSIQSTNLLAEPSRRPGIQVSSFLFYWYDAAADPANYASMAVYDPHGFQGDPWSGYGSNGYYSSRNVDWWEGVFQDMKLAGVDVAALICWGDVPGQPWFQTSVLSTYMVPALARSGVGVKIAMFDDTTSETCLWNYNNGRGWQADDLMPLSDSANWAYFYDMKAKPFFQAIPQKYWATHNGLPLEQGGRPVIYTYGAGWFTDVSTHGAALWQYVKTSFARDFKDANGGDITPFVIHESSWYNGGGGSTGDGRYSWGAAVGGPYMYQVGGYYTCGIGAGYDDRVIRSPGTYTDRQRQQTLVQWYNGTYSSRKVWDSNMLTVETWNELWEGSGIERCYNYPDPWNPGTYLSETFYIDTLHNLVQSSIGIWDNDATFPRTWEIPASANYMSNPITISARNDGALPWEPGTHSLGGRLLDAATGAVVPGTERALAAVPAETLGGGERQITVSLPQDWPTGSYNLQLDMMQGTTWFASLGDTPVTKPLTITRPTPSVVDDGTSTTSTTSLHFSWSWPDASVTIVDYQYAVGESPTDPGSDYVVGWTDAGTANSVTITGLSLADGVTYYCYVKARGQSGVWSDPGASNGIMVNLTSPGPVANLAATPANRQVVLSWTNPSAPDYAGAMVRYSTDSYPAAITDGSLVVDRVGPPGASDGCIHSGLNNGVTYYYTVFAHDDVPFYAPGAQASGTTQGTTIDWFNETFDSYPDGNLIDLKWTTTAPASAQAQSAVAGGGTGKAVLMDTLAAGQNIGNEIGFTDKTSGYCYLSLDVFEDAAGTTGALIGYASVYGSSSSTEIAKVVVQKGRLLVEYGGGLYAILTASAANGAWYNVKIGFNIDTRKMDLWLDGAPKGTNYAWYGTGINISRIVIGSDRNTNLTTQKAYIDNLRLEPRLTVSQVRDDGVWNPSLSKLRFSFDPVPWAGEYRYAIGTTSGGTQTRGWTSCGLSTDLLATGLSLGENQTYYVSAQCSNQYGTWGPVKTSDGITVAPGIAAILDAKALPDGPSNMFALRGKLVSAAFPGFFYIQEPASWSGMRVISTASAAPGDEVDVAGFMGGLGAERFIDCTGNAVVGISPGPGGPYPVFMTGASIGGARLNSYTPGVFGGVGPNNIGLLVRIVGKVTRRDPSGQYFYIDDGRGVTDGTQTDGVDNIGVRVKAEPTGYSESAYVHMTGISSPFSDAGQLKRQILPVQSEVWNIGP
ncbi:MAG: DUF5010 domain-containing protein [Armatimonadota bacterium]|nr:DUF5010 domain-containing protein [Armatimonadota bacterium]